ncbi:MAG TPA: S9 family peptidase [Caulobacteraceae bacterium]|nr:S9 family peptidase [Caulobacteraceae bacterium]
MIGWTAALAASAAMLASLAGAGVASAQAAPPLTPRTAFFGNPVKAAGRISPDGRWLAWMAPKDGVLNVWVAPLTAPDQARVLTAEAKRPVAGYNWTADSSMILYATDNGGDENFQLYGVDVATGARRALTHFQKTRVAVIGLSHDVPGRLLIQANNRDPRFFDVLSLDLKSGAITPVFQNDAGYAGYLADEQLNLRMALLQRPDGQLEVYRVAGAKAEPKPFETIPFEDSQTTSPAGFTRDGKTLYWIDSRGRDTAALYAEDVATGARTLLAADPRADIAGALGDPRTGRVQAYAVDCLKTDWRVIDPAVKPDFDLLHARFGDDFAVQSSAWADDKWIVGVSGPTHPGEAWLYDRTTRALKRLYVDRPELERVALAPMTPLEIKARDGLTLVSYLTLPAGADPQGRGGPTHPLPMVVVVHGGPWARDNYGYSALHQWLANRGYAVLSVNFRGSTGLGKHFISAADHEWGAKMQDDLLDAADWAVKQGIAQPGKVAILGGSYGGYATLAGLAFTPDAFACGVDLAGPSNLNTLLATVPPYWLPQIALFHKRMGDPSTPEGQALLKARSPVFAAGDIKRPLLIGQGTNDPRVKQAEADQIVAAMKAHDIPVTYLLAADEGHGFQRPEDNLAFFGVAEQFLAKCLGGRAEPLGSVMQASDIHIQTGGDLIAGLTPGG